MSSNMLKISTLFFQDRIQQGRFGEVEKTKMNWQKPEQAKGTTVVFTERSGEIGLSEEDFKLPVYY